MSTNRSVVIELSASTLVALKENAFSLYALRGVQSTATGGAPIVWFVTSEFLEYTEISWSDQFEAYISASEIVPNGVVVPLVRFGVGSGAAVTLNPDGTITVVERPGSFSITNETATEVTWGLSQMIWGKPATPFCAFPLYGNFLEVIDPTEKVLFFFAKVAVNTGTVVEQALGPGVLLDLTSNPQLTVSYDLENGWNSGGYAGATNVPAGSAIDPLLVDQLASAQLDRGREQRDRLLRA